MRNVTLRSTGKGTAVVLEQVILVDKKLFNSYKEAVEYAANLNIDEAFRRNRTRNVKKDVKPLDTNAHETETSQSQD